MSQIFGCTERSVKTRSKMVNTAVIGGMVFTIVVGLHSLRGEDSVFRIIAWGIVGLIIGTVFGILAQIPTDHHNNLVRLGQAATQGAFRGALIGAGIEAFILMNQLWLQDIPFSHPVTETIEGIGSFAFCGIWISLAFMVTAITSKTPHEIERRHKFLRSIFLGFIVLFLCVSVSISFIFFVQPFINK